MQEDTVNTVDATQEPTDDFEQIESLSSEAFLSGEDDTYGSVEVEANDSVDTSKVEQTDQVEETDQNTEQANSSTQVNDGFQSEAERNAYYAQRRIAAKQTNDKFVENLREESKGYVDDIDESKFEDMDETQAEILKDAAKWARQNEADQAIREVERARETTAYSLLTAEQSIPEFNPKSSDFVGDELYQDAVTDWAAAHAIIKPDSNGEPQIVGIKPNAPSPYEYLEEKAANIRAYSVRLQARAQQNAARNNANNEIVPVHNTAKSGDSLDDLEARVGDISLVYRAYLKGWPLEDNQCHL